MHQYTVHKSLWYELSLQCKPHQGIHCMKFRHVSLLGERAERMGRFARRLNNSFTDKQNLYSNLMSQIYFIYLHAPSLTYIVFEIACRKLPRRWLRCPACPATWVSWALQPHMTGIKCFCGFSDSHSIPGSVIELCKIKFEFKIQMWTFKRATPGSHPTRLPYTKSRNWCNKVYLDLFLLLTSGMKHPDRTLNALFKLSFMLLRNSSFA